jgi:hypothetical protein
MELRNVTEIILSLQQMSEPIIEPETSEYKAGVEDTPPRHSVIQLIFRDRKWTSYISEHDGG